MENDKQKNESLKISVKEGAAASVMAGSGDAYITPFALALNANNFQIGFLSSFVGLFGAVSQILGSRASYKHDRKKLVVLSVTLQTLAWLSILVLGILVWQGIIIKNTAMILIILYVSAIFFGSFGGPAWFSWMGDLVPSKNRGSYFSKRNRISGAVAMAVTLLVAFILDYTKEMGIVLVGFSIVALLSFIGRGISALYLSKQYNPKTPVEKESYFSLTQFIKKSPSNNFGRFVIFSGLMILATNIAAPFFGVYMLRELNYSYFWFMSINLAGGIFTLLSMPLWGDIGDKYGNKKLLEIGSFLVVLSPLFWVIFSNPIALILTAQVFAGFGWAAFNLGASNFIYDAVTPQRRAICVAYFTMFNGIGIFIGATIGGLITQYIQFSFINVFLFIFIISSILRAIVSIIMIPLIKEVREIHDDKVNLINYLFLIRPRPFLNMFSEIKNPVNILKK